MPFPCGEVWRAATYSGHGANDNSVDLNSDLGDSWEFGHPVLASADGRVAHAGYGTRGGVGWGLGIYVVIGHGAGSTTVYAHLAGTTVVAGQSISTGAQVGGVGNTGGVPTHLHYEQSLNGVQQWVVFNGTAVAKSYTYNGNAYESRNCGSPPSGRMMLINGCGAGFSKDNTYDSWVQQTGCNDTRQVSVGGNGRMMLINGCGGGFSKDNTYDSWVQQTGCDDTRQVAVAVAVAAHEGGGDPARLTGQGLIGPQASPRVAV